MNKERLQQVRQAILEEKVAFCYDRYLMKGEESFTTCEESDCATAACVAGMTVILFGGLPHNDVGITACKLLGLNEAEETFLFYEYTDLATKEDAIKRIDHLLSDNIVYNWDDESHGLGAP